MTDQPPLTDEELAEMGSHPALLTPLERRLIADLRANRAEVERLRGALSRAPEDWLKGNDEAWFALTGEMGASDG